MIFDTHAHYDFPRFVADMNCLVYRDGDFYVDRLSKDDMLARMRAEGIIGVVDPGVDLRSNLRLVEFAKTMPGYIYPSVGIHPTRTFYTDFSDRKIIAGLSLDPAVVAIGETGLDYHHERGKQHRHCQKKWFRWQLRLAEKRGLPVVFHIRMADKAAIRILRRHYRKLKGGVIHCFGSGPEEAAAYVKMGFYLGIGGALLQSGCHCDRLCEAVRRTPLERIVLETDAPYVHPQCDAVADKKVYKKTRNTSLILPAVAARIAELKDVTPDEVERVTTENALKLFGIDSGKLTDSQYTSDNNSK